ncbi:MAG TPA: hypothetical protein VFK02_14120 [Kofleriaceae bacterium]|nr:hypothetical protein [Kofleriaceae bacterium]
MSPLAASPRLLRGGLVLVDLDTGAIERVITLQYNPDTMTRTLQVQGATGEATDHLEQLRLKGPPIETIKLEVEIDATDQLEFPRDNDAAVKFGILPELAALETIIYPSSAQVLANRRQSDAGVMEILPTPAPLQIFVWGKHRVLPVRITDLSITEEAFNPDLDPIRAKVSLGMRVLSVNDLLFDNKGGSLFMAHFQQKERLARLKSGALAALGLRGAP